MNIDALRSAQSIVCSYCCRSHWKTSEGPPQHSDECRALADVIEQAGIEVEAIAIEIGHSITPADWLAADEFCERESIRSVRDERGQQVGFEVNRLRLAQCFAQHRKARENELLLLRDAVKSMCVYLREAATGNGTVVLSEAEAQSLVGKARLAEAARG